MRTPRCGAAAAQAAASQRQHPATNIREEDIGGLEVAVRNPTAVRMHEGGGELLCNARLCGLRGGVVEEELLEIAAGVGGCGEGA